MTEQTRTSIDADQKDRPQRGPLGDARPNPDGPDQRTRGGKEPEDVEDRPGVGSVNPEDYPAKASGKDVV